MGLYTTNFLLESNSIPEADLNDHSTKLQQLYIAYFGRAAAPHGLDSWISEGVSTKDFAAIMYEQPEFNSVNAGLSVKEQINQLYLNLFDRDAKEEGLNYWANEIESGRLELASIANDLIYNVYNTTIGAADKLVLNNKTNVAVEYTSQISASDAAIDSYVASSTDPWVNGAALTEAIDFMSTINGDNKATTSDIEDSITNFSTSNRFKASLDHYHPDQNLKHSNSLGSNYLGTLNTLTEPNNDFLDNFSDTMNNSTFCTDTTGLG